MAFVFHSLWQVRVEAIDPGHGMPGVNQARTVARAYTNCKTSFTALRGFCGQLAEPG